MENCFELEYFPSEDNNPVNDFGKHTDSTKTQKDSASTQKDSVSFDLSRVKSPEIAQFINRCAEIIKTLGDVNESLEYTTDAQSNLVQNFFTKKGVLITQKKSKKQSSKTPSKKGEKNSPANQSKGSEQPVTQHVELLTEHLNHSEHNTMESLQNSILKQASMIRHSIDELQSVLQSSIPQKFLESKASFPKRVFRVPEDNKRERDLHMQAITDYRNALAQIDTLNNQVKTLQHEKAIEKELELLTEENEKLKRKVTDLEGKCRENKEKEEELTLLVKKEANMHQCLQEKTAALADERHKNEENQKEVNKQMIDKDQEITDLRNRLNELDIEIANQKERIVSLENDLEGKESAITELKETNCQQSSILEKQKTELESSYYKHTCLEDANTVLRNEVKNSKEEISRLVKEDKLSKKRFSELQGKKMQELEISKDTITCLRGRTENLESQVASLEEDNKYKESQIQTVNQSLAEKDLKITKNTEALEDERRKIKETREELNRLMIDKDQEITDLRNRLHEMDIEISNQKERIVSLEKDLAAKDCTITDYCSQLSQCNSEKENQNKELKEYRATIQNLTANNTSLESEKKYLTAEKKRLNTELSQMRNNLSALENKNTELQHRCYSLSNDLKHKDLQLKTHLKELNTLNKQYEVLTSTVERLKIEAATRDEELDMLRQIQREIEEEKERERMRRKVSAILYTPRRGDLLNAVVAELRERLISQFADQNADLTFQSAESASQIRTSMPVLVVCINARLGTDVSNALSGVKANPGVAVVILHHKEIHALPNQSSERVLTSTEYKALGGIFDMACLSAKGLYPCDMNTNTLAGIVDFIKNNN